MRQIRIPFIPYRGGRLKESTAFIHPTARVHHTAHIGMGAWIGPNVHIDAHARVGAYSVIGGMPEHRDFYDDVDMTRSCGVWLGEYSRVFEFVTIHAGTVDTTTVGMGAAIFNHSHLAHDVWVGESATVGGHASLAGHVRVMHHAIVAGRATVHQHVVIGAYSILSLAAVLKNHVPVAEKWIGNPARPMGPNEVGLKRASLTLELAKSKYDRDFQRLKEASKL